ncbi:hypothetical protein NLI96_g10267 [Meripilus lineatus]|uniref:Cytochrome P450 n=1 Tax=Meripilus lineatus TaxID=2056292 RepID=A0AAD5UU32_9APHY|nr:hypothetical protein NLI96_g10267 [Physisporinus lineatus]
MMLSTNLLSAILNFSICLVIYGMLCKNRRHRLPYPPGPRGLLVAGNMFNMPKPDEAAKYLAYAKEFGNIYHLSSFGTYIIVVSCPKIANDLFSKRSRIYSGRAPLHMIKDLMGWDFNFAMMDSGILWKDHRKMFENYLKPSKIPCHHTLLREEIVDFLQNLMNTPHDFARHIDHLAESSNTRFFYGSPMRRDAAHLRGIAEKALSSLKVALVPVKYIPSWFPGAAFKRKAEKWRRITHNMVEYPFRQVCEAMDNAVASPCFVTNAIHDLRQSEPDADNLDMTKSVVLAFFLSMSLHSDIQQIAQEELDKVCSGRLPDFADRPVLPSSRISPSKLDWVTLAPILAIPHTTLKDDIYDGYLIPAGALVIGNTQHVDKCARGTMCGTEHFLQGRYSGTNKTSRHRKGSILIAAFGYGKRKCPGRFLADAQLFLLVASVLKTYTIKPLPGKRVSQNPEGLFTTDCITRYPLPFDCLIIPWAEQSAEVLIKGASYATPQ